MQEREKYRQVAERMTGRYTKGLISVEQLTEQLMELCPWESLSEHGVPDWSQVEKCAIGLCSQALYQGCFSSDETVRTLVLEHVQRYLDEVLACSSAGAMARARGLETDIVQQTLIAIWEFSCRPHATLKQPTTFLKWTSVILRRRCAHVLQQSQPATWVSLEMQPEIFFEELIDASEENPLETVVQEEERQQEHQQARQAILKLKNTRYQDVLLALLEGLSERELAARWQVPVQDIALWRCRGLKALRKQKELQMFRY